jgi:hypothetical protein
MNVPTELRNAANAGNDSEDCLQSGAGAITTKL